MTDIALVTGAAGALGAEVARTLSKRGYKLALLDATLTAGHLAQLASSLGSACVVAGDLASEATWREGMAKIQRDLGGAPSAAALIAGGYRGSKPLHEESDDEVWRMMMTANVETIYRSLRALLPAMVAAKRGSILVVGSRVAQQPWTGARAAAYTASKSAVVALAQAVAAEVLEHGVRVNAILPSTLDTPANRAAMPKADPSRWVPLPSAAGVVAFLLGDDARDVSGAALPLYGQA